MTVTAAPSTGPLAAPTPLTDDALAGPAAEVAAWVAYVGLEGRYAVVRRPGARPQWWRWVGDRWRRCDERMVRAAVRYALDDAYDRLARSERATASRLDRLRNEAWVWSELFRAVRTPPARLGLA